MKKSKITLLSILIPARNEDKVIDSTVKHLHLELTHRHVPHEIVIVNDGSTDKTWKVLNQVKAMVPTLRLLRNLGVHGFGNAVIYGLERIKGDGVVIMMADESDDCRDVVRYWEVLNDGYDCVFGSRFIKGGGTIDYPVIKRILNRAGNKLIQILFGLKFNDVTNAFKAYRREVIEGCKPLISRQFNLTVEMPLKAITRGFTWAVIPITWRNRKSGIAKFQIQEMGSRYLFVILYLWLEKFLCLDDYQRIRKKRIRKRVVRNRWKIFKKYITGVFLR